ncbi:hypothetical protein [Carboxylicivirga sp. M1479]|uniref:hypothetical protein n=1 Tax=Carboxylicivirga sp. M1479 TaxID=2594476 RepID=UPI001178C2D5|nr:hypothetical protein [Carboxylicivirga sp. M1479]TRX71947.1 hypothetical protein FNN09_04820 [Carboxylicivirga sp. M1479]
MKKLQKSDQLALQMRHKVYNYLLETRAWKYRSFLIYLRLFKYISFSPSRGNFLESYYTLMRYIDDIVDGDAPVPKGYKDSEEYIRSKQAFSKLLINPADEVDYLMIYCMELANKIGEDFTGETDDILSSLLFDAKRRGKYIIFPEKELLHHFHIMDVRGTIKATLKLFKEEPDKYTLLQPLGLATRIHYDLQDYESDLEAGYVNISKEDCERFGIRPDYIRDRSHPSVQAWFVHQANKGLKLINEHHENMKKADFSYLTKCTLPVVYEWPAKKFLMDVLNKRSTQSLEIKDYDEVNKQTYH